MRIAIHQPYYYPYIGYFELINAVDTFVFLTDVQYVRRGWMNRNRIRCNKNWTYLTIPVIKSPQETLISDIIVTNNWHEEHKKSLLNTYGKKIQNHPLYCEFLKLSHLKSLCEINCQSINATARYLKITTPFRDSREFNINLTKEYKLIGICQALNADKYLNASGGRHLYQQESFQNIDLEFIEPTKVENKLSILDLIFGDGLESL